MIESDRKYGKFSEAIKTKKSRNPKRCRAAFPRAITDTQNFSLHGPKGKSSEHAENLQMYPEVAPRQKLQRTIPWISP